MNTSSYVIAIDGNIGVGKTSLARELSQRCNGRVILEEPEEVPFLSLFYQDPSRYALQTQLTFLAQRYRQLKILSSMQDMFYSNNFLDYTMNKDYIYARINLNDEDFMAYNVIYNEMYDRSPQPNIILFLQSPIKTLLKNIKKRNKLYERPISFEYLSKLDQAYSQFYYLYKKCPVLIISVKNYETLMSEKSIREIEKYIFDESLYGITHIRL